MKKGSKGDTTPLQRAIKNGALTSDQTTDMFIGKKGTKKRTIYDLEMTVIFLQYDVNDYSKRLSKSISLLQKAQKELHELSKKKG